MASFEEVRSDPCAGCVSRRAFVSQAVLLAAAAALSACGSSEGGGPTAPQSVSGSIRVADHAALATVGGIALVTLDGAQLAVTRTGTTSFVALSRVCTHQGNIVNISGSGFLCPGHGARFTATGNWTGGQETSDLRTYPTSYDATTGTLTIG